MGMGIIVCGLNGCGKSTLGKAIAERLQFHFYNYAVLMEVPKDIRVTRVRDRSFRKFGKRMQKGGDLYETEESFFEAVRSRSEAEVEEWLKRVGCPVLRVDGTKDIEENVSYIIEQIQGRT